MSINFSDPNQTQHDGKINPISNQEFFDAGLEVLLKLYLYFRIPWGDEALKEYEANVSKGWTLRQIVEQAFDRYDTRQHLNLPSGANPPSPLPDTDTDPAAQARNVREGQARQVDPDGRDERADNGKDKGKHVRTELHDSGGHNAPVHKPADRPGRPGAAQRG